VNANHFSAPEDTQHKAYPRLLCLCVSSSKAQTDTLRRLCRLVTRVPIVGAPVIRALLVRCSAMTITREPVVKVAAILAAARADMAIRVVALGAWQDELGRQFRVRL
jgi:hypothetical protein